MTGVQTCALPILRIELAPVVAMAMALLVAAADPATAAMNFCQDEIRGKQIEAASELDAKKAALADWTESARQFGVEYTRWGIAFNLLLCAGAAHWPLAGLIVVTTSLLVAARNFKSAWLMRALGEADYAALVGEAMHRSSRRSFLISVLGETLLFGVLGGAYLDSRAGHFETTGNPLDLALEGPGYFVVQTKQGLRYTRNGQFQLDKQGYIVNSSGCYGGLIVVRDTWRE